MMLLVPLRKLPVPFHSATADDAATDGALTTTTTTTIVTAAANASDRGYDYIERVAKHPNGVFITQGLNLSFVGCSFGSRQYRAETPALIRVKGRGRV